ncbi:MAG: pyrroline-5-carboxylate reductase [Gammaproteobacteria bacterium]|nr:MAG: pyrroline-5-carboxylate reductase [Gammaproteobacteria bacterium]
MDNPVIGFIGGGNMAASLIGGLIADGVPPSRLWVAEPDATRRKGLEARFGVQAREDNRAVAEVADVLVLAVKPQVIREVARALAPIVQARRPLVISIAAGVRERDLERWMGKVPLVRAMPNTPALVQSGATALHANPYVDEDQRAMAESILRAVGITLWVEEEAQMDAVTALSGSGPAYFFLVMEAMQEAGHELGLPLETARILTLQTALGAARMALESEEDVALLRRRVTSPGGTTEQALRVLEEGGIRTLFKKALKAAYERSRALAQQLGDT